MINKDRIPKHIAIIMDGNGRWAKERGLPRTAGHRQGAKKVRSIIQAASELGVRVLTLFAFSHENWSRPKREVGMLMRYLNDFLDREASELIRKNIRFLVIGRSQPIPEYLQEKIRQVEERTRGNTALTLVLALNYGSRQEIVDAAKKIAEAAIQGQIEIADLSEDKFSSYLYTYGLDDPDLLIRTSGEKRISNFLLWQLSYTELYFTKKYWPDFNQQDLKKAITEYQSRQRRFGGIDVFQKAN
jgi:undecaprenyl diphosphate synthase